MRYYQRFWQFGKKMRIMLGLLGVLLLLGCENSLDSIKDRRILHIGISKATPPFGYVDSRGEFAGLEVLLGKKLAKDLLGDESRVSFQAITQELAYKLLESGELDIVLASSFAIAENPHALISSTPYMYANISVLGKSSQPKGIQELAASAVLVRQDSIAAAYFASNYPTITLQTCLDLRECLASFVREENTYFADSDMIITALARQNPSFVISVPALSDPYPIAPLLKSSSTSLHNWLDKEITILHKEGFLKQAFSSALQSYDDEQSLR